MAEEKMAEIIFTTDLLRIQDKEYFGQKVLSWSIPLMIKQIEFAAGKRVLLYTTESKENFDAEKFYELCGYEPTTDNWVKICNGEYSDEALDYFSSCFKDSIVITQEAGAFIKLFEELGIPYIDFYVSAIRFCSDLFFAFRSNIAEVREVLKTYRVPQEQFFIEAGSLKAHYKKKRNLNNKIYPNSLLLCGQGAVDLSLIKNGKLVSFMDYRDKLENLFSKYSAVYYKAHPAFDPENEAEQFIRNHPSVNVTNINTYELLSCDNISAVAALSSGILIEARYFEKEIYTISHNYANYWDEKREFSSNMFVTVSNEYRNPLFWANLLSSKIDVTYADIKIPKSENFLRQWLNLWWGYEIGNLKNGVKDFALEEIQLVDEEPQPDKITSEDITVVVQGEIGKEITSCLKSIRKCLPDAEIVLSTWYGNEVGDLDYDVLVLNTDPGCADLAPVSTEKNDVNRQIVSTRKGLGAAKRKYSLKLRTDCKVSGDGFVRYMNQLLKNPLKREVAYKFFNKRIMIGSHFTRNPNLLDQTEMAFCFHPSDIWFFGLTEDLKNLFDIPLQTKYIATIRGVAYEYRRPEQHIWISFLEKQGIIIPSDSIYYNDTYTRDLTNRSILNNFFVLNSNMAGIDYPPHNLKDLHNNAILETLDYLLLYKNLYHNNYKIPVQFRYKTVAEMLGISGYCNKLSESKFVYEIPFIIFKIISKSVLNSYKLLWWDK